MTLRTDHVAGGAFIAFGILIFALSGDLPTGRLSMPGAGFLPKLVAGLMMIFGLVLVLRARESAPFATIAWSDGRHAAFVTAITAAAIACYERLGFITTMMLMMAALLIVIERRHPARAAVYSVAMVMITYVVFAYGLKAPMPPGPLGF